MKQQRTRKSAWIYALKIWNKERGDGVWIVPKKGTKEYSEVKAIMDKGLREGGFIGSLLGGLASAVLPNLIGGLFSGSGMGVEGEGRSPSYRAGAAIRCTDKAIKVGEKGLRAGYKAAGLRVRPDLENMSLRELAGLAQKHKISNYGKMKKQQLYDALIEIYPL